jgi:hypothetical protein
MRRQGRDSGTREGNYMNRKVTIEISENAKRAEH